MVQELPESELFFQAFEGISCYFSGALVDQPGCLNKRWVVAYSGGIDSSVLLHSAKRYLDSNHLDIPIHAIHVNHSISAQADDWQYHCEQFAASIEVSFESAKVCLEDKSRNGLEQLAREARYAVFADRLQEGDVLLMAHHLEDQSETFVLRLMRGAGPDGLQAVPMHRKFGSAYIFRPFLNISRQDIELYAKNNKLTWVYDPSNDDMSIARNAVRHRLLPVIKQLQPDINHQIQKTIQLISEQNTLLKDLLKSEFEDRVKVEEFDLDGLDRSDSTKLQVLLRMWFGRLSLKMPSSSQLESMLTDLVFAAEDARSEFNVQGVSFKRYQQKLFALSMERLSRYELIKQAGDIQWCVLEANSKLELAGLGVLQLDCSKVEQNPVSDLRLTVSWRKEGEKICLNSRLGHQSLKKLFQQHGLAPWLRATSPLIYFDGRLVAVPELHLFSVDCPNQIKSKLSFSRDDLSKS